MSNAFHNWTGGFSFLHKQALFRKFSFFVFIIHATCQEDSNRCEECLTTRFYKQVTYSKYLAVQLPVIVSCAFFYIQAGRALRQGSQNSRKRTLVIAFGCLWLCWLAMTTPFAVFEVYRLQVTQKGLTSNFKNTMLTIVIGHDGDYEVSITTGVVYSEWMLFGLKQTFAVVNSCILVVLIRPFQEPLKAAYRKVCCKPETAAKWILSTPSLSFPDFNFR